MLHRQTLPIPLSLIVTTPNVLSVLYSSSIRNGKECCTVVSFASAKGPQDCVLSWLYNLADSGISPSTNLHFAPGAVCTDADISDRCIHIELICITAKSRSERLDI